jgi:hypothetical protein
MTAVLLVLLILQIVLARLPIPALAALHGINALILVGLGGYLVGSTWAFGRRAAATSTEAGEPVSSR